MDNSELQPITAGELLALWRAGAVESRSGPLREDKAVILAPDTREPTESECLELAECLRQLPCPSVGIQPCHESIIAPALDVLAANEDEAGLLLRNIKTNPLAATTLVQLLRASALLPAVEALTMESLAYGALQGGPEHRQWLESRAAPQIPVDDEPPVLVSRDGDTLSLELNRPKQRNAMSTSMRSALIEALSLAEIDTTIEAIEIRGRGACFSVGGDLEEFGLAPDPATAHAVRSIGLPARWLLRCAEKTTVFVHSACIGAGIEFPAFAGRIVADPKAFFQLPELSMGLIPGAGGCVSIPRRIGRQRTAWMVLSGRRVSAAQALEWGLIDEIR